ncbi:MAG: sigma-70 family RNA polymerase sigma factor, partial [Ruminococcus sp.]|nr:sigma-70 family RNA polymerase sigma factor [Ruminococcus sp.]
TPVYVEDEDEEKLYQEFRALLTEEEKLIADMRWNKQMTQKEIAEALGYKSHSAVTKKLKKMREKFDAMRK